MYVSRLEESFNFGVTIRMVAMVAAGEKSTP